MKKHLSRKPKQINPDLWYYEENGGLELWSAKGKIGVISIRNVRGYMKRKDSQ